MKRSIAVCLLAVLLFLSGCGAEKEPVVIRADAQAAGEEDTVLRAALNDMSGAFHPLWFQTAGDERVVELTNSFLYEQDRSGTIITDGIRGTTLDYNGKSYAYQCAGAVALQMQDDGSEEIVLQLRNGLKFSDGSDAGVEDLLFTLYVCCDPSYDGPWSMDALPILGLGAYRSGEAKSIAGLVLEDSDTLRLLLEQECAEAEYLLSIPILPLHYYGEESLWHPEEDSFGFEKGNLSGIREKTGGTVGCGAYVLKSYSDGTAVLAANPFYYLGCPKIARLELQNAADAEQVEKLLSGELDLAEPKATQANRTALEKESSITTLYYPEQAYGFIACNAAKVKVGEHADSDSSKALRRGFMTLFAALREESLQDYYGANDGLLELPYLNANTEIFSGAYADDRSGTAFYREDMSREQRQKAALDAARAEFLAAGFHWDEKKQRFTDMEESYTFWVSGNGRGDQAAAGLAREAAELLEGIGVKLELKDVTEAEWLGSVTSGEAMFWAGCWELGNDDALWARFHSGGSLNYCSIADAALDRLLLELEQCADAGQTGQLKLQCAEILMDWGCELPFYQRMHCLAVRNDRINEKTLARDQSAAYPWYAEIERLQLK